MLIDQIDPEDIMFAGDRDHYFLVGESALHCIRVAMLAAKLENFKSILDLPSGYGRVLRHLKAAFPDARLTACDIDRKAVAFCAEVLGARPVYGHESPPKILLEGNYDLIWVGSLLTHLDANGCREFLDHFHGHLSRNGLLLFTLHGRFVAERIVRGVSTYGLAADGLTQIVQQYKTDGFGYARFPQKIASWIAENYGTSLASPDWVFGECTRMKDMRLVNYTECGWDNHQDVIALLRL